MHRARRIRGLIAATCALWLIGAILPVAFAREGQGHSSGVEVANLGVAAPTFPALTSVRVGDSLYIHPRRVNPPQLVEYDLTQQQVVDTIEFPGPYPPIPESWAIKTIGNDIYMGLPDQGTGRDNFFKIDTVNNNMVTSLGNVPNSGDTSMRAMAISPDGKIFIQGDQDGLHRERTLYEYDPQAPELGLTMISWEDSHSRQMRAVAATETTIYVASDENADLVAIDRETLEVERILPDEFVGEIGFYDMVLAGGKLIATTRVTGQILVMDLDDYDSYVIDTVEEGGTPNGLAVDGNSVYATVGASGTLYEYDLGDRTVTELARPVPYSPVLDNFVVDDDIVGVALAGYVYRYSRSDGDLEVTSLVQAGAEPVAEPVQSLTVAGRRAYVGGSSSLTIHNLETGELEQHAIHGEPKAMTPVGDSIYMANYPGATLWKFDPDVGEPERIGGWDSRQNRPRDIHYDLRSDAVLVASTSDTLAEGGWATHALGTDEIELHPFDRSVLAVTSAPRGHSARKAFLGDSQGTVTAYDLGSAEKLWEVQPVPGGALANLGGGLVADSRRLYGLTSDATFFVVDLRTQEVLHTERFADIGRGRLVLNDRMVYAAGGSQVIKVDPRTLESEIVVDGLDGVSHRALSSDEHSDLYLIVGTDLVRVRDATVRASKG